MSKKNDVLDDGDKVSTSLSFKKNLGNYQMLEIFAGVTVTKRTDEDYEEVWQRAWAIVESQLDNEVEKARELLGEKD